MTVEFLLILIGVGCISFVLGFVIRYVYARIDSSSVEQVSNRIINEAKMLGDAKTKQMLI